MANPDRLDIVLQSSKHTIIEYEEYCRLEIERIFGEVDPTLYESGWMEEPEPSKVRREFNTYAVKSEFFQDAVWGLIRSIRYDQRKNEGWMIARDSKQDCRMAWRRYPYVGQEDGWWIACCRLVWWVIEKNDKELAA